MILSATLSHVFGYGFCMPNNRTVVDDTAKRITERTEAP